MATINGQADQGPTTSVAAAGAAAQPANNHRADCICKECLRLGPKPCDHDHSNHPNCKCHCPNCHQCEIVGCGCHCGFCHKCESCTEDCQCFYCYEETGVCLECDEDCEFCQHGSHEDYCGCDYCTRRMVSDGTFHEELLPGSIKDENESAYLHRPYPCTAIKHSPRFFYDRRTSKELRAFVRARGLPDPYPGGVTLKCSYIRVLEAADRSPAAFRFLDLPPEIRTLVYAELLSLDRVDAHNRLGKIHTQILQTCQLVNKEGTDVLYTNSPALCLIATDESFDVAGYITYRTVRALHHEQGGMSGKLLDHSTLWPTFLKRIRHIRLSIHLHDWIFEPDHEADFYDYDTAEFVAGLKFVRQALRQFTKLLAGTKELKKLEVFFELHPGPEASAEDEDVERAFSMLRPLRNLSSFTLTGDVPDDLELSIAQAITSSD